jgi:hypothetical protein
MGVYLSYSRGALAVTALGLLVMLAAAPTWPQLRAAVTGVFAGAAAAACASIFPGVASLTGTSSEQQRDGAIMLTLLVAIMLVTALVSVRAARAERGGAARVGWLPHARRLPTVAVAAAALCVAGLVAGGLGENSVRRESAAPTASRFASVSSVRYEYWRVGLLGFTREPVHGLGAGGFRVFWRMERRVPHAVTEVHSLPLEMGAELGLPGVLLFLAFVGGVAVAGRRALSQGAPLAPAATAVTTAWLLHATIDWDWQVPAVTLPVLVLAAGLLAAGEERLPGAAPEHWVSSEVPGKPPLTVAAS